jgi:hypothetical protein
LRAALRAEEVLAMNADRNLCWDTKCYGGERTRRQWGAYSQQAISRQ